MIPSWKTMISLVGESRDSTILSFNDYLGKPNPGGTDALGNDKFTTYTSYTVLVEGNDFSAENLTIENTAGRVGQAANGDGWSDCTGRMGQLEKSGTSGRVFYLNNGSRQWFDYKYLYPLPFSELQLNPNLK